MTDDSSASKFSTGKSGSARKHYVEIVVALVVVDAALFIAAALVFLKGWSG
jgi:hypothetical protein